MTTLAEIEGARYEARGQYDRVRLAEGKSGKHRLVHVRKPAGFEAPTANMRCAIMGGQKPTTLKFEEPTTWHELRYDGGTWMSDFPCEQAQHESILDEMHGDVLVGGLGLGLVLGMLWESGAVERITVIEKSADVMRLVGMRLGLPVILHFGDAEEVGHDVTLNGYDPDKRHVRIIEADLHEYLRRRDEDYDAAFYDIWQSDGLGTFFGHVVPLRQWSRGIPNVLCWNEDVMRGQLVMGLISRMSATEFSPETGRAATPKDLRTPQKGAHGYWWNWAVPFFQYLADHRIKYNSEKAQRTAAEYARFYGHPGWWSIFKHFAGEV